MAAQITGVMEGDALGSGRRQLQASLIEQLSDQLCVMDHIICAAKLAILLGQSRDNSAGRSSRCVSA